MPRAALTKSQGERLSALGHPWVRSQVCPTSQVPPPTMALSTEKQNQARCMGSSFDVASLLPPSRGEGTHVKSTLTRDLNPGQLLRGAGETKPPPKGHQLSQVAAASHGWLCTFKSIKISLIKMPVALCHISHNLSVQGVR